MNWSATSEAGWMRPGRIVRPDAQIVKGAGQRLFPKHDSHADRLAGSLNTEPRRQCKNMEESVTG